MASNEYALATPGTAIPYNLMAGYPRWSKSRDGSASATEKWILGAANVATGRCVFDHKASPRQPHIMFRKPARCRTAFRCPAAKFVAPCRTFWPTTNERSRSTRN